MHDFVGERDGREGGGAYLISCTYLSSILDVDDSGKLHEPSHIKVVRNAKTVAVSSEIVPLINIYTIPLVCYYFIEKTLGFWPTEIWPILVCVCERV